ncbi:hypothetical protein JKG68_22165 [Microvirga aerilata]|uniref:Transposase n=1 Tax=Microvirga aerilata TaxID=670292 RepID=A0A936ZBG7_9HYPH|nr:hypothetical protein [Microvirga aerilata]
MTQEQERIKVLEREVRQANEIRAKPARILPRRSSTAAPSHEGVIDKHREAYGGEPICRVLAITPSTYYEHAARKADPDRRSARERQDAELTLTSRS